MLTSLVILTKVLKIKSTVKEKRQIARYKKQEREGSKGEREREGLMDIGMDA